MDTRADWSEAYALVPSLQVGYVWYASIHTLEVLQGLLGIGFELAGQIIWDKGLFSVGRSWYHWAHEPYVVVRRPGVPNERIDVLGMTDYTFTLTARAKAHGWDVAFGADVVRVKEGQSGRGERRQAASTDLNVPVVWPLPVALIRPGGVREAAG